MELCRGKIAKEIIDNLLKELDYVREKLLELSDSIDDEKVRELCIELETELRNYCIGDCSLCTKSCEIFCDVECHQCPRFFKCLQEKKVSRMIFS